MNKVTKLDAGQKHMLRLVEKGANADGWAEVSSQVFPLAQAMPTELVTLEPVGDAGRGQIRLTQEGKNLLAAMEWL